MYYGQYVFAQITKFLPKRYFERMSVKYDDRTRGWSLTHWNHLLERITNAQVHDVNSMDWLTYEPLACYVFDRGHFDLARLYEIHCSGAFFIIREKFHPTYEIESGIDFEEGEDNVLRDQTVRFTGKRNKTNYPAAIRRIVYYSPELRRTFTYYTNNFYLEAKNIALLYKYRWQVELFFYDKRIVMRSYPDCNTDNHGFTGLLLR